MTGKKTWQIIFLMLFVTVSVCFGVASFFNVTYKTTIFPPAFMSKQAIKFEILQLKLPDNRTKNFYLGNLQEIICDFNMDISVLYDLTGNDTGFAVYSKNITKFNPPIVSGRTFSEDDITLRTNSIIISEDFQSHCQLIDGALFYPFNGANYEVIGVYKNVGNFAKYYLNLMASNLESNIFVGRCYLDGQDNNMLLQTHLRARDEFIVEEILIYSEMGLEEFLNRMTQYWIFYFMISSPLILLFLSAKNIGDYLIELNKKKIYVHVISGATKKIIHITHIKKILLISLLNFVIASVCYFLMCTYSKISLTNHGFDTNVGIISFVLFSIYIFYFLKCLASSLNKYIKL